MKRKYSPVINPAPYIIKLSDSSKVYDEEFLEMIDYLRYTDITTLQVAMKKVNLSKKDVCKLNYTTEGFREILQAYTRVKGRSAKYRATTITYPFGEFRC